MSIIVEEKKKERLKKDNILILNIHFKETATNTHKI